MKSLAQEALEIVAVLAAWLGLNLKMAVAGAIGSGVRLIVDGDAGQTRRQIWGQLCVGFFTAGFGGPAILWWFGFDPLVVAIAASFGFACGIGSMAIVQIVKSASARLRATSDHWFDALIRAPKPSDGKSPGDGR